MVNSDGDFERKFEMSAVTVESEPLFVLFTRCVQNMEHCYTRSVLFFSCLC